MRVVFLVFLAVFVALFAAPLAACGEVAEQTQPELVARPSGTIRAVLRDGSHVVVVHDEGIDWIAPDRGGVTRAVGAEYRACPEATERLGDAISRDVVAIAGDSIVLSLHGCDTSLWTRALATGGPARRLAPRLVEGDWPGAPAAGLPLTVAGDRVIACAHRAGTQELWSFDLSSTRRERLGVIERPFVCRRVLADAAAAYVLGGNVGPDVSTVVRFDLHTGATENIASDDRLLEVAQDETALYLAASDGEVTRIDKRTRERASVGWPADSISGLVSESGTVFGIGVFRTPSTLRFGVWTEPEGMAAREVVTFAGAPSWVPFGGAGVALLEDAVYVPVNKGSAAAGILRVER
jgi:hypothetical protein